MHSLPRLTYTLSLFLFFSVSCSDTFAQEYTSKQFVTPLRLGYIEGAVSFWRPGAPDWVSAAPNLPLAVGDSLFADKESDLELQMGNRNFIRADGGTQINLINQTPDFIQFNLTSGRATFDLRLLPSGYSVEIDTSNVVFTIDHAGYYRVEVDRDGDIHFTTRRGGLAMMVPLGGSAMSIHPSEEIVVVGPQVETYAAPELDRWDHWNYERTENLIDTQSDRYIPYGISGASDLDHYGNWRLVPDYGTVWMPDSVPPGWAPYSTGRWSWDPDYQWTWIDDEPWGWAPFHYGRWVNLNGYWAWVPGPAIRNPAYSPALVAFFNTPPNQSGDINSSGVAWVALSWGEPVKPWWGKSGFIGKPSWNGWGGPRVVNNTVINNTTHVNTINITYNNIHVDHAVVATTHEHFGNGHVHDVSVHITRPEQLEQIHGALSVQPGPTSLVSGRSPGNRPPDSVTSHPAIGTRISNPSRLPWLDKTSPPQTNAAIGQRVVTVPKPLATNLTRPEFGNQTGEERPRPEAPPRFVDRRHAIEPAASGNTNLPSADASQSALRVNPITTPEASQQRYNREISPGHPSQESGRTLPELHKVEAAQIPPQATSAENRKQVQVELPGKPANRVFLKNKEKKKEEPPKPATKKTD